MTITDRKKMTADEFFEFHSEQPCELLNGEINMMTPAGGQHGNLAFEIAIKVGMFMEGKDLGKLYAAETGFILSDHTVRAPDLAFVAKERVVETVKFIPLAPDLVVEVISPNDTWSYVDSKATEWLNAGVQEVWLIDPAQSCIHQRSPDHLVILKKDQTLKSQVLHGFELSLSDYFKNPSP